MPKLSKEAYIALTCDLIAADGIETVTIRHLARKLHCSSASLYRHFDSLEQLLVFASLRFLKPYIAEVAVILSSNPLNLETYFKTWNIFIRYSFKQPKIFQYVFFNKYRDMFKKAVEVYYQTLSDDIHDFEPMWHPMLTGDNIHLRDRYLLMRCISLGRDNCYEIEMASDLIIYTFKGMLNSLIDEDEYIDKQIASEQFNYAMRLICKVIE